MRNSTNERVVAVLPLLFLALAGGCWAMFRGGRESYRDLLWWVCLIGLPLLVILLAAGAGFYRANPGLGLLTALALLLLVPISHDATPRDGWQALFGLLSGAGGGVFTLIYLALLIRALNRQAGDGAEDSFPDPPEDASTAFSARDPRDRGPEDRRLDPD